MINQQQLVEQPKYRENILLTGVMVIMTIMKMTNLKSDYSDVSDDKDD